MPDLSDRKARTSAEDRVISDLLETLPRYPAPASLRACIFALCFEMDPSAQRGRLAETLRMRPALLLGGVILLLAGGIPSKGEGHAIIMESSPKAGEVLTTLPSRLVIRFNGRIVHALSRVTLLGPDRQPVPFPSSVAEPQDPDRLMIPLPPLSPGTYLVRWKVLSLDGHVTQGGFSFCIAPPSESKQEVKR